MKAEQQKGFLEGIQQIHSKLDERWPGGRVQLSDNLSDHHWTLKEQHRPVSVSTVEALFLFNLVDCLNAESVIEIGTGFGYSAFWMAAAIHKNTGGSGSVVSIDDASEGGSSRAGLQFARAGAAILGLESVITFREGTSPAAIEELATDSFDLAFIDGSHRDDQPTLDFEAVERCLSSEGVVVWHDVHSPYSVMRAIKYSESIGFYTMFLPTSCRMAVSCRRKSRLTDARLALANAINFTGNDGRDYTNER